MKKGFSRQEIAPGVFFSSVTDDKFKHNSVSVYLATPLDSEYATENAAIALVLRQGCATYPDFTGLERRLCELYGAELGSDVLSYGEYQLLNFGITGIDDRFALEDESISEGCASLLADMLLAPNAPAGSFDPDVFEIERGNLNDSILAEINDKRGYALQQCRQLMCAGTRLAVPKLGYREKTAELTPGAAFRQYEKLVREAGAEVIFTGCGDPGPAMEMFAGRFAAIDRQPRRHTPEPAASAPERVREKTEELAMTQSKLVMGYRAGIPGERRAATALKFMAIMLGGTPLSKLFVNVREKRSLCYYCAAALDPSTGILTVDSGVDREKAEETRAAVTEQIAALAAGDFTDEELEQAKLFCRDNLQSVSDSLNRLENWYIRGVLSDDVTTPEQSVQRYQQVTRQEVMEAAAAVAPDTVYLLAGTGKESE